MTQQPLWKPLILLTVGGIAVAKADVPPWSGPPKLLDEIYGKQIREAGHDCPQVTSATPTSDAQYKAMIWGNQEPLLVTCNNNRHFVVAQPPKRPINSPDPLPPAPSERIRAVESEPGSQSATVASGTKSQIISHFRADKDCKSIPVESKLLLRQQTAL
jgi:hypothetical protein